MLRSLFIGSAVGLLLLTACEEKKSIPVETEDSPARSAEEEMKTFVLEEGFKIQLVASEPLVQDPIAMSFDEDGRLWVVEMRGFMTDLEGSEEDKPIGRISILEDTDSDGQMDKGTVYLDSLVMPRAVGLVRGGALIAENNSLWMTQDLDGDLVADTKVLFDSTYSQNGIPEHSDNGLLRAMDNWYYSAKSRLRYKEVDGEWIRDSTEARGQWGLSQDDEGRLIYNYNWSQLHGDLVPPNYLSRNANHRPSTGIDHGLTIDRKVFPIRSNPAVNRGYIPGTLDERNRLLEFTAACSPLVYRSETFPKEYYGNVFVCEPSGNLIKRNVVEENGAILTAFDPNPGTEFLASTDERFRPTNTALGPDGGLYISDMYRGLIQHGAYVTPYLKEQTIERGLVLPVHLGRIWRIVPEDWEPSPSPKYSQASTEDLVEALSHENGWHRDMAQRLLVERNDPLAVALLEKTLEDGASEKGRLHALWALEGLGQLNSSILVRLLDDNSIPIKNAALRILEQESKNSDELKNALALKLEQMSQTPNQKEALQIALSSEALDAPFAIQTLKPILANHGEEPLIRDAVMSSLEGKEFELMQALWNEPDWSEPSMEREIFMENLASAVVKNGDADELEATLALINSSNQEFGWREKSVLMAMSIQAADPAYVGSIQLASSPELFSRSDLPLDDKKIGTLKSLFVWPGHEPELLASSSGILDEGARKQFAEGRQKYLTSCAGCHGSDGKGATRMGPPLAGSEWVLGDEKRLALILLHGMEGPLEVAGKTYDAPEILPVMPSHSTMDDGSIASILTYIRNEWGNEAPPISRGTVGFTRHRSQGRVYPWSAPELNEHIQREAEAKPEE
ncbi:DUF7133 domain-containing protein [Algoriphagus sediminis]|uniref:C-type cytochrome n=1 Tax=Algoriphagus sediminis TaxID=3057113 RepID=A0ABT7YCM6_9BACT|nr:c-type cytochrome [Algoriphagus sediminis]MDN3204275.1 c-type cytochrome [Algoriphagus sediminis]